MFSREVCRHLPHELALAVDASGSALREIRLRANREAVLVDDCGKKHTGVTISDDELRKTALSMMKYSVYARENELSKGFFTLSDGCRVGVCGTYVRLDSGEISLQSIGSMCIRIAREVRNCAYPVIDAIMEKGVPHSCLIVSPPGYGKTTILRDAARILSSMDIDVAVVDERHEIAACRDGVPTLDVGASTDVLDGCPRREGMEMLIRSMAPRVIITDEIGSAEDMKVIMEAARKGVSVIASAHAESFEELENGDMCEVLADGTFRFLVLLKGAPGKIAEIRRIV